MVDVVLTNGKMDGLTPANWPANLWRAESSFARFREPDRWWLIFPTPRYRGDVLTIVGPTSRTAAAVAAPRRRRPSERRSRYGRDCAGNCGRRFDRHTGTSLWQSRKSDSASASACCWEGWSADGFAQPSPTSSAAPGPTLWIFESIGLSGFVAIVGLNAGPDFVRGLKASGPTLIAGLITIMLPLLTGVIAGRYLFKMHPGVMLGVIAEAAPRPRAGCHPGVRQERCAYAWYGVSYAVGNVLLALWGTVIVLLLK